MFNWDLFCGYCVKGSNVCVFLGGAIFKVRCCIPDLIAGGVGAGGVGAVGTVFCNDYPNVGRPIRPIGEMQILRFN